ncbi:ANFY1-like protein, partial [Mya arenaria]
MADGEVVKLQNHLRLLREEYVKLQKRLAETERKYQVLAASAGQGGDNNFVNRLLNTVAELDLVIHLEGGQSVHGHRFVLAARSDHWGVEDLARVSYALMKWVYTDEINIESDSGFLLELLRAATRFKLEHLRQRCENGLMSYSDFTCEDFASMPAPLLYNMFKAKTDYPLHTAIRAKREDVVFLYLIEYDSQLSAKLNEVDSQGDLPLDLALDSRQESVAQTLVSHHVNTSSKDNTGKSLLHKAIKRGDEFSASFLIKNKADVNMTTHLDKESPLHMAASFSPGVTSSEVLAGMARITEQLGESVDGDTGDLYGEDSFAAQLLRHGSNPNATEPDSGDSVLHSAAWASNEKAAIFLATHGARPNLANNKGETPLHIACEKGLTELVKILLDKGGNPNAQTKKVESSMSGLPSEFLPEGETTPVSQQTPLHLALLNGHSDIVNVLNDSEGQTVLGLALWSHVYEEAGRLLGAGANINERNTEGMSLLHQAIEKQDISGALFLIEHQADIALKTTENQTPLQHAIERHLPVVVEVLCQRGVDMNITDDKGNCPLWQALDSGQEDIAHTLVKHGCDVDLWLPGPGDCRQSLLHRAIDENNESVACFLIRSNCDKNSPRRPGPNGEGGEEARDGSTPLHQACAWGMELVVQALMEAGAEVNTQDIDAKTPVHIAIENQHAVIISLLLSHPGLDLTVRDKNGLTPFAAAMTTRNNKAAQSILNREPRAAEQVDNRGRNFLHIAILNKDIESVLFLISVHANVTSRVQDSKHLAPLHMAVDLLAGAEVNALTNQKQTSLHIASSKDHSVICTILLENGNPLHVLAAYGKDNAAAIFELFRESMPEYPIAKTCWLRSLHGVMVKLVWNVTSSSASKQGDIIADTVEGYCVQSVQQKTCLLLNTTSLSQSESVTFVLMFSRWEGRSDTSNCVFSIFELAAIIYHKYMYMLAILTFNGQFVKIPVIGVDPKKKRLEESPVVYSQTPDCPQLSGKKNCM